MSELTPEAMVERFDNCLEAYAAKDKAKLSNCYAANGKLEGIDHLPRLVWNGRGNIIAQLSKTSWGGFSKIQLEPQLTIVSDNKLVAIVLLKATRADKAGAGAKRVGLYQGVYAELNQSGEISLEQRWLDQLTLASQLGDLPGSPVSSIVESGWKEKVVAVAADTETEQKNRDAVRRHFEAYNARDADTLVEMYAEAVELSISGMTKRGRGAARQALTEHYAAFSDLKEAPLWVIVAGDYVAVSTRSTGTFDGLLKGAVEVKGTGRKFMTNDLNIYQLADGKISRHWVFSNGYSLAVQLGFAQSPEEAAKAEAAKKADAK